MLRTGGGGAAKSLRRGALLQHLSWDEEKPGGCTAVRSPCSYGCICSRTETHTRTRTCTRAPSGPSFHHRRDSSVWTQRTPRLHRHHHHHCAVRVSLRTFHPDRRPCISLIRMRKGLHRGESAPQHAGEDKEEEMWRESGWQHRRAEKKLLAFWTSLSLRTWTLIRPRERAGFQRSASAARLLKSEA